LAESRDYIADAVAKLTTAASDSHPRVSTEALRGLSFVPTIESVQGVLAGLQTHPEDSYVRYTGESALGANLNVWQTAYIGGKLAEAGSPAAKVLDVVIALDKKGSQAVPHLQVVLGATPKSEEERNKAMTALADIKGGNADNGKVVFRRGCIACHKVYNEGADFGPDMMKVGTRLDRYKLVESIIDPNAAIDPKYQSTSILTTSGQVITGLLVSESDDAVVIFDGKEKRTIPADDIDQQQKLNQSSMPEGLAATISPSEFLDLIEFLSSLK
jgi:putative heme-binding domain-containing protein